MFRKTLIAALLSLGAAGANAQLAAPGDLGFTAYNADEDGFSIVALKSVAPGTNVFFTDNEYDSTVSAFNGGESYFRWVTDAITAGTVIRFSIVDPPGSVPNIFTASRGVFTQEQVTGNTDIGFSASNEVVYAYLSATNTATAPTTFLGAVSTEATAAGTGFLTGTGLAFGSTALNLTANNGNVAGAELADYIGDRENQSTFDAYRPLVNNPSNFAVQDNGDFSAVTANSQDFTVNAVPEPETYALMLAGLALVGWNARRRKS